MMGLQATIKTTTKRKYEIETDCEAEKKEASPPKSIKFSEVTTKVLSPIINNNKNNAVNNSNGMIVVKSIKSDIIPLENHPWHHNEPIVDSISKLQAVTETWSNSTLSTIPFNCTSSTLTSLAQTAENITRSTLATTLLDDDLLDDDEDDFQDDFDFDDDDDDDLLLEDQTILSNQSPPIRYPPPSPVRQNYIPAYPKPGYTPENYQNCSRTPTTTVVQYNHIQHQQPHLRPSFFHGTNNGSSWNYYNQHQHYDPLTHQQQQQQQHQQTQTIRCAENGKSYFELGSSNYCGPNRLCIANNGIGMMKNCCEGRNNLWCTTKQCYKEKRLKMMNLSMFKLARFRQASDQSLYRSVLICNTLKSLEKEIEIENQIYHQRMSQHRHALQQNQSNIEFLQSFPPSRQQQNLLPESNNKQQQQQTNSNNNTNLNNESSMINCNTNSNNNNNLSTCNGSFSQPYINNCIINRIPSFNDPMPIYEHHPLKDPSSGRATPFPSPSPVISQLASNSTSDADSAFGDVDDVDSSSTRSIDWGSVLSLSSQSALDPLSNNDIFTSTTPTSLTQTSSQSANTITNLQVTISNSNSNNSTLLSNSITSTVPSSSTGPISSTLITTLTTVSSCSLESLTASSISVSQSVSNSNWDFPYLETDSSSNSDYYELNCYKLSSALNQMDDFVKSDQLMATPVSSVSPTANDQLGTHIMVGS